VTTVSGPPIALFLNNQGLVRAEFRAAMYLVRVTESAATALVFLALGLFSAPSGQLAWRMVPSVVVGLPIGMFILRRIEPEAFRRVCMSANTLFITFGLARSLIDMGLAPAGVAYTLMMVVNAGEWVLVVRYFLRRRASAPGATA
jgi:uncharacterized membrane protein YfcA